MSKVDDYRAHLRTLDRWDDFLRQESGLPGPRANLELAAAVAEEGDEAFFRHCLSYDQPGLPPATPANTPTDYLIFCGVVGYGKLLAKGNRSALPILRRYASDARWRIREGVALGLQYLGAVDMPSLIDEMEGWSKGNLLEQRAAVAALCEPKLLKQEPDVVRVLQILNAITAAIPQVTARKSDAFMALRKGLGYCWSVAVAAAPAAGKAMMERWLTSPDPDIRWIMRENLAKNRLARMDAAWVAQAQKQLAAT
jgi:hypothetical protein